MNSTDDWSLLAGVNLVVLSLVVAKIWRWSRKLVGIHIGANGWSLSIGTSLGICGLFGFFAGLEVAPCRLSDPIRWRLCGLMIWQQHPFAEEEIGFCNDRFTCSLQAIYLALTPCFSAYHKGIKLIKQFYSINSRIRHHWHICRPIPGCCKHPEQAVREAAQYAPAPVRRTLQPSSSPYMPYACGAPCAMNIQYRQAAARSGRWHRLWCRSYKLCSYLNSQPKRHVDLDFWPFDLESSVQVRCDVGYLCVNCSLPRPLCSQVTSDVRNRQTDVKQTLDKSIT